MKKIKTLLTLIALCGLLIAANAQEKWMTRGAIAVTTPGIVETVLPMELHRTRSVKTPDGMLDLSLIGPDGNNRAFELFWRAAGSAEKIELKAERNELLDDKRVLWETTLPAGYRFDSMQIEISHSSYAGKVDAEGLREGMWFPLVTGLPVQGGLSPINFNFPAGPMEKVRFHFSGYDQYFAQTPVFVQKIEITGQRQGSDFAVAEIAAGFEQTSIENGVELRVFLPGSGLKINRLEISTSANFKGEWQLGQENIVLGKRDFSMVSQGEARAIGSEWQKIVVNHDNFWNSRVMLIKLTSEEFFGKVTEVKVHATLPRLVFAADQPGEYFAQTGLDKSARVLDRPAAEGRKAEQTLTFAQAIVNQDWQAESLLKGYSSKGGPFQPDGYSWKASFVVEKPGFIQLATSDKVCLDKNRSSLRIVKDGSQIPYFLGREELRELDITVEKSYEAGPNQTEYLIKLPEGASRLAAIKFKTQGIFERNLILEKHVAGELSWQPWQQKSWSNDSPKETEFTLPLYGFPEDQYELRMTVQHLSNQPLEIEGFKGLYNAQDLFFIAAEPGNYELVGGNQSVRAPIYDLAMVQNQLLELFPEKVEHAAPVQIMVPDASDAKPVDQGAAFNNSGYSWMASFTVAAPGFYQLGLNQQASLDDNRAGIRLVKNGIQVPYFFGQMNDEKILVSFKNEYEKTGNNSICTVELPVASRNWHALSFSTTGIFMRNPVLEIRKPGRLGWKTFKTLDWSSRQDGEATLDVSLEQLPAGEKELRLVIANGDNRPLEISSVKASYHTQDVLFQASEAGEYQIYGGNSKAKAPVYDLALIKNNLLKIEPRQIKLGDATGFTGTTDVQKHLEETFSETGWGLYLVLGLVTALLLVLIIKLFPEENKTEPPTSEQ